MDILKWKTRIGAGALLTALLWLFAPSSPLQSTTNNEASAKGKTMSEAGSTTISQSTIPALDAAAPPVFATAAFGLG